MSEYKQNDLKRRGEKNYRASRTGAAASVFVGRLLRISKKRFKFAQN